MKIKITQQRKEFVADISGMSPADAIKLIHDTVNTEQKMIAALQVIKEQFPSFDLPGALKTAGDDFFECVVRCVRLGQYKVLDFIFDSQLVSENYISESGSPLILYAMQAGIDMISYFISRGAHLIVDGDFVKNNQLPHVTAQFCACGNKDTLNMLFNVMLSAAGDSITSVETKRSFLQFGIIMGRSTADILEYTQKHAPDTILKNPAHTQPAASLPVSVPLLGLLRLVNRQCTSVSKLAAAGEGCTEKEIRLAFSASLIQHSLMTYTNMRCAFPNITIQ